MATVRHGYLLLPSVDSQQDGAEGLKKINKTLTNDVLNISDRHGNNRASDWPVDVLCVSVSDALSDW